MPTGRWYRRVYIKKSKVKMVLLALFFSELRREREREKGKRERDRCICTSGGTKHREVDMMFVGAEGW